MLPPVVSSTKGSVSLSSAFADIFGECSYTHTTTTMPELERSLRDMDMRARHDPVDDSFCVIDYWNKERVQHAELWPLAKVIYAASASQCMVERDFSVFNGLFTSSRTNISERNLNNTLFVALNSDLIDKAPQQNVN